MKFIEFIKKYWQIINFMLFGATMFAALCFTETRQDITLTLIPISTIFILLGHLTEYKK